MSCYVDTSALAKWYVLEHGSHEFAAFVDGEPELRISRLCVVELRCLLARRRRSGLIDEGYESRAYHRFLQQLTSGYLTLFALLDEHLVEATSLIVSVEAPLRTLDAIHLAAARSIGCSRLATGDRVMQAAAAQLGLDVVYFGLP
ncbi:MAG TPA: type II toxin-antitoxin system VapC family toxin [Geminicoccaceae bacterium]|nr:type II toxin-antitoxin system VapC family toxin [Geminicoccus sp.]HMU49808.1 type II toxin-antitoxin system VapC family toxin [Geminicoccaceae bacterium]